MARKGTLRFRGFGIPPVAPTTSTRPEPQRPAKPGGDWIEKGFSSTPLASDAIDLKPSDVSAPAGGSGEATEGGTTPPRTKTLSKTD